MAGDRSGRRVLLVSGLFFVLAMLRAGAMPLTDPDEGRYAEIAREMVASGDYVVPHLFSIPYLEKPPLLYWLTALSFRAFGESEIAARLVPALTATAGVVAVGLFASMLFAPASAVYAALALGLCGLYIALARVLVTDTLFAITLSIALLAYLAARERRVAEIPSYLLFWLALAAATLSKGPAALVLCGLVVLFDAAISRRPGELLRVRLWIGLPLFLCLALPWFVIIERRYPGYFSFYLWKEHLHRAAGSEHAQPFYFFAPCLLIGGLPWTPWAFGWTKRWLSAAREDSVAGRSTRFLLIAAAVVFGVFSLARGKLITYILPMFPPLAVLAGHSLAQWASQDGGARRVRVIVVTSLALYTGAALVAPAVAEIFTIRPHIRVIARLIRPDDDVVFWGGYFPSAAFYLRRYPYLIGSRQELQFGRSLVGDSDRLVPSFEELRRRAGVGRLFFLTDTRDKRLPVIRSHFGAVEVLAQNFAAQLIVAPPLSADGTSAGGPSS
jgi:4-amino-4-deoxy-L-arabinose transferase-like glycosyltransferase